MSNVPNRYLPPAGIDDFSRSDQAEELRQGWHTLITDVIDEVKNNQINDLSSPLFYDQLADQSGVPDSSPQGIPWNGFPLRLTKWFAGDNPGEQEELANRAAEVVLELAAFGLNKVNDSGQRIPLSLPFRIQDEYCEWFVERDGDRIRRIYFTCEPPEYWGFLAKKDFALVHQLYKELLHNDDIPEDDLRWPHDVFTRSGQLRYRKGDYNPWNVWNTKRGAIHLTHPANSLEAEIFLASDGTVGWPVAPDAQGNVDEIKLMCCAGRGGINRSSDPLILRGVFGFARQGLSVALANPIGLYMSPFTLGGLLDPDENPIGESALKFVRASADGSRILRAEVAPPEGATFTLEQCTLDGLALTRGGQIARGITMRLFGVAKMIQGRQPLRITSCPQFCCDHPTHTKFKGTFPFEQFSDCSKVKDKDWRNEAFDIPDAQVKSTKAAMEGEAEAEVPLRPLMPKGRKIVVADLE